MTIQDHLSGGGQIQACEQGEQGRLAGTGWPNHGHGLTFGNGKTNARKNGQMTLGTANLFADFPGFENYYITE